MKLNFANFSLDNRSVSHETLPIARVQTIPPPPPKKIHFLEGRGRLFTDMSRKYGLFPYLRSS